MSWLPEKQAEWIKERSCTRKKKLDRQTAFDVIMSKPYYAMYHCQYCGWFHLTKSAAHRKYRESENKMDDEVTAVAPTKEQDKA